MATHLAQVIGGWLCIAATIPPALMIVWAIRSKGQ